MMDCSPFTAYQNRILFYEFPWYEFFRMNRFTRIIFINFLSNVFRESSLMLRWIIFAFKKVYVVHKSKPASAHPAAVAKATLAEEAGFGAQPSLRLYYID